MAATQTHEINAMFQSLTHSGRHCPTSSFPHLLGGVTHDAAEERLLEVRYDLAGADDHSSERHHLINVLRVEVPQRFHLPQVVRAHLFGIQSCA